MNVLRKILLSFLGGLLGTVLIGVAWTNIGASTVRNRQVVSGWFDKSNFYSQVADIAVENIEKDAQKSAGQGLPVSDPAVKVVVKNALSSDFIKTSVTSMIDSAYQWFGSSDKDLAFKLDLNPVKTQIVDGLTAYAKTRAADLPKCGAVDGNGPVDPLTTTCLPRGVTPDQVASMAHDYVLGQEIFKKPIVLGSDIMVTKNNQSIPLTSDYRVAAARKAYKLSGFLPLALTIFAILLVIGIVFLSSSRLRGLSVVGTIFLTTGIGLLVVYAGLRYFFDWGTKHLANMPVPGGLDLHQKLGIDFTRVILNDVERILLVFVIAYIVIGIGAKGAAIMLKRRNKSHRDDSERQAESIPEKTEPVQATRDLTPVEPRPIAPSAPVVPKGPRPPRKIQ